MADNAVMSSAIQRSMTANRTPRPGTEKMTGQQSSMGKDSFLKLLVTQLQHQDPTRPMEDREFISQMAQFSSLDQMTNMNNEMKNVATRSAASEAYSMLGKRIEAYDETTERTITGTVSSVIRKGGEVMLKVGREEVPLASVHSVSESRDEFMKRKEVPASDIYGDNR